MASYSDWFETPPDTVFSDVSASISGVMVPNLLVSHGAISPPRGTGETFPEVPAHINSVASGYTTEVSSSSMVRFGTRYSTRMEDDPNTASVTLSIFEADFSPDVMAGQAPGPPVDWGNCPPAWLTGGTVEVEYRSEYAGVAGTRIVGTMDVNDGNRHDRATFGRIYYGAGFALPRLEGSPQYPGSVWRGWLYQQFPEGNSHQFESPEMSTADTITIFAASEGTIAGWSQSPFSSEPSGWTEYATVAKTSYYRGQARFKYSDYRFVYTPDPEPVTNFGSWALQQRQNPAGSSGGWPLRQRHRAGKTGAWPLRMK